MPLRVIVCETTGDWATALRGELPREIDLVETRSLPEVWQRLVEMPGAIVALETAVVDAPSSVEALVRMGREFPSAVPILLAHRNEAPFDAILREAGAVHVVYSPRGINEIVEILNRRWRHRKLTDPEDVQSENIEQHLLTELPWPV